MPTCCAAREAATGDWSSMDENRARSLLQAERAEVQRLLAGSEQAGEEDRESEDEEGGVDSVDPATSLTAEGMDDAIAESMRDRLAAIDRALKRLDDGSYGRSVRSGAPIPDERLEADPAAELTVEEARQAERAAEREQAREVGE
jgi:DnaK suppressor protein